MNCWRWFSCIRHSEEAGSNSQWLARKKAGLHSLRALVVFALLLVLALPANVRPKLSRFLARKRLPPAFPCHPFFRAVCRLLRLEFVHRRRMVLLTRLQQRRWKARVIRRIGKVLRLQAKRRPLLIRDSAFSLKTPVQKVARIKLNARLRRPHF